MGIVTLRLGRKATEKFEYNLIVTAAELSTIDRDLIFIATGKTFVLERFTAPNGWIRQNEDGDYYVLVKGKPKDVSPDEVIYLRIFDIEMIRESIAAGQDKLERLLALLERF